MTTAILRAIAALKSALPLATREFMAMAEKYAGTPYEEDPAYIAVAARQQQIRDSISELESLANEQTIEVVVLGGETEMPNQNEQRYLALAPNMLGADFNWNDSGENVLVFSWPKDLPVGGDCDKNIDALIAHQKASS